MARSAAGWPTGAFCAARSARATTASPRSSPRSFAAFDQDSERFRRRAFRAPRLPRTALGSRLARVGASPLFLDLSTRRRSRPAERFLFRPSRHHNIPGGFSDRPSRELLTLAVRRSVLPEEFDAMLFVRRSSPSRLIPAPEAER